MNPLLTPKQVSELINCKPSSVYAWAKEGKIPAFKINGLLRFDLSEVREWIERCRSASGDSKRTTRRHNRPVKAVGIDGIVRRAIDTFAGSGISSLQGKPDRIRLEKEGTDGTL